MFTFLLAVVAAISLPFSSPDFQDGKPIPVKYTADGADVSPVLQWGAPPAGTRGFALIMHDQDAPAGDWTHWLIYNIPADAKGLPENVPKSDRLPDGSLQGSNDSKITGYSGPRPPSGTHRYVFELYALDTTLPLYPGAHRREVDAAINGHILAQAQLVGLYTAKP